jgi:predicted nucleic acid-binding Zn ribbon protein
MPRFDFQCLHPSCKMVRVNVYVATADAAKPHITCATCGALMEKLPSAPNFVVNGYNAKNGYSK